MRPTSARKAPRRGRSRAGAVSVAAALALTAGLLQFTVGPALAADGADMPTVTLTGEHRTQPRPAMLAAADNSGYLSVPEPYWTDSPAVWTGRDGSTRDIPSHPGTRAYNGGLGLEKVPGTTNVYQIRRYATNEVTRFYVPAGDRVTEVFAENRLLVSRQVGGKWTLILLEMPAGGGRLVERPVTGLDDDFAGWMYGETSDTRGAAFWYKQADGGHPWRTVLFDFATAAVTYVPSDDFGLLEYPHLAGNTVLFYAIDKAFNTSRLYVVDREHPKNPGHLIDVPEAALLKARAIGDWVLYPEPIDNTTNVIRAVPVTGGPVRTLLTASAGDFVDGDDGSFSIAGGTDAEHWSVQRVTLGPDGVPVFEPVAPLPPVSVYEVGGVAVDQGRLLLGTERVDSSANDLTASALTLSPDGTLTAAPPENLGDLGYEVVYPDGSPGRVRCTDECLRFTGTGEGNIRHPNDEKVSAVLAASGSYSVVRTARGTQEVRDGSKVLATGSWPSTALWGNTLWAARADSQSGTTYERFSLPSMRKVDSLNLGWCVASELQVVGRYVYWSCGPNKQAGVYDQQTHEQKEAPRGYAQLGDGYLVSQDDKAGKLLITYLEGAVPADKVGTEVLGRLPSPAFAPADLRGRFWNVDRFGGPVAYLTASGDVTVKWPQVATSPLTVTDARVPTSVDLRQGGGFEGTWHLSRPTTSWKLTVAASGGTVVRTITGGPARGKITASWDGRAENGSLVRTGTYRVTLTARTPAETSADTAAETAAEPETDTVIYDKSLSVRSLERHDFGRDGIGDLLTFDSAGRLAIQPGTGRGTIDTAKKALAGGWPVSSAFVPFGDLSGDACNDLLVRNAAGQLLRYDGTCGRAFTPKTPPHRVIGTGFGGYNVLTSPGDLTGDGRADLIARDKAGVLWRYAADGKGGLSARVKLVGGQGGYTRLVGAGDLNADGVGDMVGLDRAGVLWRWLGNGKGAFGARVKIAGGIGVTALAVPGDLTGDGRPDLLGRDSKGALWRWNGTGAATFGTKTRIAATGWNSYTALY